MNTLPAVLTIVTIAAITPGPNNFIVMSAAVRGGVAAVLPAIGGVIGGSIALLILIWAGAGSLFVAVPEVQTVMRIAGASYLLWLGICIIRSASTPADEVNSGGLPNTAIGVASFQLMNPKSWVLVLTAISATGGSISDIAVLLMIFSGVMAVCLAIWAIAGRIISRWLVNLQFKIVFDIIMGLLLVGSGVALIA